MRNKKAHNELDLMRVNAAKAESLLKELSSASRLVVLCNLAEGERTVSQLTEITGLSQSALSQHLARLREAKLIEADKRGKAVYYKLSSMEVKAILSVLYLMYCK